MKTQIALALLLATSVAGAAQQGPPCAAPEHRLDLAGGLDERGRMVLSGLMPGPDGAEVAHEISWEALGDGTVKQHWRVSKDGGEAWQDAFVGIYRPAGETAAGKNGRN